MAIGFRDYGGHRGMVEFFRADRTIVREGAGAARARSNEHRRTVQGGAAWSSDPVCSAGYSSDEELPSHTIAASVTTNREGLP